ncbi:MAG: putative sulfate exporter family transporter [Elusimicrobia bacterium]|nr:putative sulfate exporter family transporter [Elusimicrobiota bacterium]
MNEAVFWLAAAGCLLPQVSAGAALVLGIAVALAFGNPYAKQSKAASAKLLAWSVMALGAGMNLLAVARVGLQGFGYTIVGIAATLALGLLLARLLKVERHIGLLISVGTAICGGSAIAAAAAAIRAKSHQISVALATVFCLNAAALLIFPPLGRHFGLAERAFGLWSALAIHDTSSVVGSALQYGPQALEVAATVKLARALWIVPVTFALGLFWPHAEPAEGAAKAKKPWFILGFLAAAALVTFVPELKAAGAFVSSAGKRALVLTLFLIGSGLSRSAVKEVGWRPFAQGIVLWLLVGTGALSAILAGWVR